MSYVQYAVHAVCSMQYVVRLHTTNILPDEGFTTYLLFIHYAFAARSLCLPAHVYMYTFYVSTYVQGVYLFHYGYGSVEAAFQCVLIVVYAHVNAYSFHVYACETDALTITVEVAP